MDKLNAENQGWKQSGRRSVNPADVNPKQAATSAAPEVTGVNEGEKSNHPGQRSQASWRDTEKELLCGNFQTAVLALEK